MRKPSDSYTTRSATNAASAPVAIGFRSSMSPFAAHAAAACNAAIAPSRRIFVACRIACTPFRCRSRTASIGGSALPVNRISGTPESRARSGCCPNRANCPEYAARIAIGPALPMPTSAPAPPPTGTLTFLFTDIEGSTRMWQAAPDAMQAALARHDAILRHGIEARGGHVFKTAGDAFCAAFATPWRALEAALAVQQALRTEPWPPQAPIRVRMALHSGAAELRDGDYFGPPLNHVARLLSAGHGGQTLVSSVTCELCHDRLPAGAAMKSLGEHGLKDLARRQTIYQLGASCAAAGVSAAAHAAGAARRQRAVDRRAAVRQHEPRRGERVLRRRAVRGAAQRPGEDQGPARGVAHVGLELQGHAHRHPDDRPEARRGAPARGQRAQGRQSRAHHRAADRGGDRLASVVRDLRSRADRHLRRAGRHRAVGRRRVAPRAARHEGRRAPRSRRMRRSEVAHAAQGRGDDAVAYQLYLRRRARA